MTQNLTKGRKNPTLLLSDYNEHRFKFQNSFIINYVAFFFKVKLLLLTRHDSNIL